MHDTLPGWGVSTCMRAEEQRSLCAEGSALSSRRGVQEGFHFGVPRFEKHEGPRFVCWLENPHVSIQRRINICGRVLASVFRCPRKPGEICFIFMIFIYIFVYLRHHGDLSRLILCGFRAHFLFVIFLQITTPGMQDFLEGRQDLAPLMCHSGSSRRLF